MSWSFETETQCDLFSIIIGCAREGEEQSFAVDGALNDDGFVRTPNATAVLEGSVKTRFPETGESYTVEGFGYKSPLHPEKGHTRPGLAIATAGKDMCYFCAVAAEGKALEYEWLEVEGASHRKAGYPTVYTFEIPTYLVVVKGCVLANGNTLTPYRIGKGTEFRIEPDCPSVLLFAWDRELPNSFTQKQLEPREPKDHAAP